MFAPLSSVSFGKTYRYGLIPKTPSPPGRPQGLRAPASAVEERTSEVSTRVSERRSIGAPSGGGSAHDNDAGCPVHGRRKPFFAQPREMTATRSRTPSSASLGTARRRGT